MSFSVEIYQNEYLPEGADEMHAVVRVTSSGGQTVVAPSEKAVVLVVDTSGSMDMPGNKIREARHAAANAIRLLPDGTLFALVAGSGVAECVYPSKVQGLVRADNRTRSEAVEATRRLRAKGGTAISTWLDFVRDLEEPYPDAIRLAFLLTDGKNESEPPEVLAAAIQRALGVFQCDTRGVGADYSDAELRKISDALLGRVDMIRTPEQMDTDFQAFMDCAIGKNIGDVRLRVWIAKGCAMKLLKQVVPDLIDLKPLAVPVNAQSAEVPIGAWSGHESRDYHLLVALPRCEVGLNMKVAGVSVVVGDASVGENLVTAIWTDDLVRSTQVNREVARCTGSEELSDAIQEGLEARDKGDAPTATARLGRAVQISMQNGDKPKLDQLLKVVDIDGQGTVRLRDRADELDVRELQTGRTKQTVQLRQPAGSGLANGSPGRGPAS